MGPTPQTEWTFFCLVTQTEGELTIYPRKLLKGSLCTKPRRTNPKPSPKTMGPDQPLLSLVLWSFCLGHGVCQPFCRIGGEPTSRKGTSSGCFEGRWLERDVVYRYRANFFYWRRVERPSGHWVERVWLTLTSKTEWASSSTFISVTCVTWIRNGQRANVFECTGLKHGVELRFWVAGRRNILSWMFLEWLLNQKTE